MYLSCCCIFAAVSTMLASPCKWTIITILHYDCWIWMWVLSPCSFACHVILLAWSCSLEECAVLLLALLQPESDAKMLLQIATICLGTCLNYGSATTPHVRQKVFLWVHAKQISIRWWMADMAREEGCYDVPSQQLHGPEECGAWQWRSTQRHWLLPPAANHVHFQHQIHITIKLLMK